MLTVNINNQESYSYNRAIIVSDAVNFVYVKFNFDSTWDGYSKTYQFTNGTVTINIISNETTIAIPREVLISGSLAIKVFGTIVIGTTITNKSTMKPVVINVIDSQIKTVAGNTSEPTATEIEQLNAKIDALEDSQALVVANNALDTAETAETNSNTAITTANLVTTNFNTHLNNYYGNSGTVTIPTITINGNGTLTLSGGKYVTYTDDSFTLPLIITEPASIILTPTDNTLNYVIFNGLTQVLEITTDRTQVSYAYRIPILTVYREGTTLHILAWGDYSK